MTLTEILDLQPFHSVYQPILRFEDLQPLGFEALTRFRIDPDRGAGHWFQQAALHGHTTSLEHAVLRRAIPEIHNLPPGTFLTINLSPSTLINGGLLPLLAGMPLERLVIELTEHEVVPDYEPLREALAPLREAGLKLAVDDLGAGFASLRHVLRLRPDIIKLDSELTQRVDSNPDGASLIGALAGFARDTECMLVAEGVETRGELQVLRDQGVHAGQGYYLGEPAACPSHTDSEPPLSHYRRSRKLTSAR